MELLDRALVRASILLVAPLNVQAEAALSGSGETQAPLQAFETPDLRVFEEARVIELHQGLGFCTVVPAVEPRNRVEKGRSESTRDDVALELHSVSLRGRQRPLCQIDPKVVGCGRKESEKDSLCGLRHDTLLMSANQQQDLRINLLEIKCPTLCGN